MGNPKTMYEVKAMLPNGRVLESRVAPEDDRAKVARSLNTTWRTMFPAVVVKSILTSGTPSKHTATVTPIADAQRLQHPSYMAARAAVYGRAATSVKSVSQEIPAYFEVVK